MWVTWLTPPHVVNKYIIIIRRSYTKHCGQRLSRFTEYWLEWITATRCCTALHPAASRYCSERRTMQPGSSSRLHDVLVPGHYCGTCTGCPFNTESSRRSLCWLSWAAAAPQHRLTSVVTSMLASVNGHFARLPHHYWTSRSPERTLLIEHD